MDRNSINSDLLLTTDNQGRVSYWRNVCGFWCLGLCNNFAYVVMLSAAHDILKQQETNNTLPTPPTAIHLFQSHHNSSNSSGHYDCNPTSTAAVLLADILPTLFIKLFAPFFIHAVPYGFRVLVCIGSATASFLVVSLSTSVGMSILGVIFASVSSGLGELSFLALTVYFDRAVLSGWGSGTGGAGVGGALLYSALTQSGLTPQLTLLIMLLVPALMAASYYFLLVFPPSFPQWSRGEAEPSVFVGGSPQEYRPLVDDEQEDQETSETTESEKTGALSFTEKLIILKGLLWFIVPLAVVYFAEYFINQGLLELLFFPDIFLSHAEQYRWYQTLYQAGVLVSRSSLCCLKIRCIGVLSALQCVNAVLLTLAVYYQFLPSVWMVFIIVLYEGLLGGAAYVNTFYYISKETGDREREFSMAAASVGDSLGIALSGATAMPLHHHFCSL
ncbi:battenin isoform X1 [Alosa sapidissima]|uniref:battenin isoform X1 n=1 Tax=Alosa sapidissima TaxID=34773 RepID=UPI001C097741|nr:battenin isoform X1 [Alosa sapidissima]XP_041937734.1 battenin isoform X2 [Alosa sapidissima]XP_041937735.1 battenin isoform X3 [Alosa sapidissima]XP_041937736.1 battenin isoform X1 [Alosa sapidissima]